MELHEELRRLTERLGTTVLDDPDNFRAAVDDFLDEDTATRGQVHLLVDTIGLGAYARLIGQLDGGASPEEAIEDTGHWLARERGTTDEAGSRWACAVLGYAAGRFDGLPPPADPTTGPPLAADPHGSLSTTPHHTPTLPPADPHGSLPTPPRLPSIDATSSQHIEHPDLWPTLLGGAAAVGALLASVFTFWTNDDGVRNGWAFTDNSTETWPWLALVVAAFSVLLLLVSAWRLVRGPRFGSDALGLIGATGMVSGGLLLVLASSSVQSMSRTTIGAGLWLVWGFAALALVVAGAYARRLAGAFSNRSVASSAPLAALLVVVVVLASVTPWLTWYDWPLHDIDGWGRWDPADGTKHSARVGILLTVVAAINVLLLVRLRRRRTLTGPWIVLGVIASTMGLAAAAFATGPRIPVVVNNNYDFAWGVWPLQLLGLLCAISLVMLVRTAPRSEP